MTDRCPTCSQLIPPKCRHCGDYVRILKGVASHQAAHAVEAGEDGRCTVCRLATKERMGRPGHVWDHVAEVVS